MSNQVLLWIVFAIFVIVMLSVDLGLFQRQAHVIRLREALIRTGLYVTLALVFNAGVYVWRGPHSALEFLTGYLVEESLSVDNMFVFLVIFSYFRVPPQYQARALLLGILGALIMRAIFIVAGVTLIHQFHWIIYVFGAFLIVTGIRLAMGKDKEIHPEKNPILRLFRRFMPVTQDYVNGHFFVKQAGRYVATPLFVVVLVIETTDVIFAVDSIPAVLAITLDPFIVYTSNVFAIVGLRALYFALAGLMPLFRYLDYGLCAILVFVGVKMLIGDLYKIPIGVALGVVVGVLILSVIASVMRPASKPALSPAAADPPENEEMRK